MIRFVHPTLDEYRTRRAHPCRSEGGRGARRQSIVDPAAPLVSIVTPVRNGRRFIERAIESVLAQTYPNIEYVVADAASTDGTVEVLRRFGDSIDRWVSEPDQGIFDGMNRALAMAAGELVKVHAADDVMPSNSAEKAVAAWLEDGRGEVVIRSDLDIIDADGQPVSTASATTQFRYVPAILHPTWYVPMRVYERFGLYDPYGAVASDYEMYFHLQSHGVRFLHAPGVLARFRRGGASTSTYGGVVDGFLINRRYQGFGRAAYITTVTTARVAARHLSERVLGERTVTNLRRRARAVAGAIRSVG